MRFLAGGMVDFGILDNSISALSQKVASNIYETRRMDEEQANLVSALMNAFCKNHPWKDGSLPLRVW